MHRVPVFLLTSLVIVAAMRSLAGESPYNPGAPSNSSVLAKTSMSYYCTAQGNGESKWYVTGFEAAPNFGTPQYQAFELDAGQAFIQYMNATYGQRKVMYSHCTFGESKALRPSWDQMQSDPRFKETVHMNWHYGQTAASVSTPAPTPAPDPTGS